MNVFGGNLTKVLAVVAAFLTVTAGVPHIRCVCPDGRVKLFCSGLVTSGCCDTALSDANPAPGTAEAKQSCCCAVPNATACCGHLGQASSPNGDGWVVAKSCACERSLVVEAVAYPAEAQGDVTWVSAVVPAAWGVLPVVSADASRLMRVLPRFLLPTPDRVVQFCHFTC